MNEFGSIYRFSGESRAYTGAGTASASVGTVGSLFTKLLALS